MREGIMKFNAGDEVHLSGVVTCYNKLDYRVGHGKIVSVQMQETRPYAVQLKDSTGGWCSASEVDLSLISRPNGREVPDIPVGSRVRACGVGLGGEHVDSRGILDSTDLTNFPYGVRFEPGHLVWFQKHSVYPAEACDEPVREKTERAAEYQVGARVISDVSGTCAHDKPGRGTTMLSVGTRVLVHGSSAHINQLEGPGVIIASEISATPYKVQMNDGAQHWLPVSAVCLGVPTPAEDKARECRTLNRGKEDNQGETMSKVYCCGVKNDQTKIIVSVHDMGESVAVQLHNTKTGWQMLLLEITAKGIVRYECQSDDFIALDTTGRVAIVD